MSGRTVLITGGGGYLGRHLARELVTTTRDRVILWGRAPRDGDVLLDPRVEYARGDLTLDRPLAEVDAAAVTDIVHTAAAIRFNVERDVARRVNIEGTAKVAEFARGCPRLTSFTLVGTVYQAGLVTGTVDETWVPRSEFANHYEWSKHEAERLLMQEFDDLPWRIARTATIAADDDSGAVGQVNAVHNTFKLLYYGLLSILPGEARTPVHLVTADACVRTLLRLLEPAHDGAIVHGCPEATLTLGETLETAFDTFQASEAFRSRQLLKPLLCDADSFRELQAGTRGFGGDVLTQAMDSVSPFAGQLFAPKTFSTARWRTIHPEPSPDPAAFLRRLCHQLVEGRFGKGVRRAA